MFHPPLFRRVFLGFLLVVALFAAMLSAGALGAQAQVIIDPPPMPPLQPVAPRAGVVVQEHTVAIAVDGPLTTVRVKQVFRNDGAQTAEGSYIFPLPKGAAVSDLQLTVDGVTMEGEVMDADEARAIYEAIVRSQRDPALLEYLDRGLFQASVFPIPPGATRTVEFTYVQTLDRQDGLFRLNYPLRTNYLSSTPVEQLTVAVELANLPGLRTIYSPSHAVTIERSGDDGARVTYVRSLEQPVADFDLYFGVSDETVGVNLLSYKPAGEDGFFVLMAAPALDAAGQTVVARDLVLVVDISGSMQGDKIVQARAAAQYVVEQLNPDDRFTVIAFSSGVRLWKSALQPVTDESVAAAVKWIQKLPATGATDINRALLEAMAALDVDEAAARPAYVLFLTDGQPTQGELEPQRIIDNARMNAPARTIRLFTFGIGYDVNTDLLDILSADLGGVDSYIRPDERVDEAVSAFYNKMSTPILTTPEIEFDGLVVSDLYPYPLPDLYAGEQLVVVGRYPEGGVADLVLSGVVNGEEMVIVYPDVALAESGGEPAIARLWANRAIGALLDQIRRTGPTDELIDAIVALSLQYGIVTPYTSYLVQEPTIVAPAGQPGADAGFAAPQALHDSAAEAVAKEAESVAAAPASGAAAVEGAIQRSEMQVAGQVQDKQGVRYVAGRTFTRQGVRVGEDGAAVEFWVDTLYTEEMAVTEVVFGSAEYFALAADPMVAAWLAISPELLLVTDEENAVRVRTVEDVE
jgi:Ca-activated chloride channel family protein